MPPRFPQAAPPSPPARAPIFVRAFLLSLAAFLLLNLAWYFLRSTSDLRVIGFPSVFWRSHADGTTTFRSYRLAIDLIIALYGSYRIARRWTEHRLQRDHRIQVDLEYASERTQRDSASASSHHRPAANRESST